MLLLSHPSSFIFEAGTGVIPSPVVERREIPLPSLLCIYGDCGEVEVSASDHNRVFFSVRIRDSTGQAVIKNIYKLVDKI